MHSVVSKDTVQVEDKFIVVQPNWWFLFQQAKVTTEICVHGHMCVCVFACVGMWVLSYMKKTLLAEKRIFFLNQFIYPF